MGNAQQRQVKKSTKNNTNNEEAGVALYFKKTLLKEK